VVVVVEPESEGLLGPQDNAVAGSQHIATTLV
jgi:hypothetical protein